MMGWLVKSDRATMCLSIWCRRHAFITQVGTKVWPFGKSRLARAAKKHPDCLASKPLVIEGERLSENEGAR